MTLATFAHSEVLAPFFLLVGMQLRSETSHVRQILLPTFAAIGGMLFPAIIYYAINQGSEFSQGWPIVMPTDIALVMAVLLLLGKKVSAELKTFMLAIAVADDLFSIAILGIKYSHALKGEQLLASIGAVIVGVFLWKAPYQDWLARFVNFLILPTYIFANLYPTFTQNFTLSSHLGNSIVISRVVGKLVGIALFTWLATRVGALVMPAGLTFIEVIAGGLLAGMGLAVSFLIANLSFTRGEGLAQVQAGLVVAALVSGVAGALVLVSARQN